MKTFAIVIAAIVAFVILDLLLDTLLLGPQRVLYILKNFANRIRQKRMPQTADDDNDPYYDPYSDDFVDDYADEENC